MDIAKKILLIAQEVFMDNTLTEKSHVAAAIGYDSMAMIQFILELESEFKISLEDVEITKNHFIEQIANIIEMKRT